MLWRSYTKVGCWGTPDWLSGPSDASHYVFISMVIVSKAIDCPLTIGEG